MISDKLRDTRAFEAHYGSRVAADQRPAFHVTPTIG